MSFRLETKIEPTMTRRLHAGMHANKLTHIGGTPLERRVIPREANEPCIDYDTDARSARKKSKLASFLSASLRARRD